MTNELTVRVEHPELPAIRWNEAEVQQNLTEMLAAYTGRVYTPESIKDAKADRAAVNKLDKQLADAEPGVIFGGRLGEYKYYDMDKVIEAALDAVQKELA